MPSILFFDLEVNEKTRRIEKIGAVLDGKEFSGSDLHKFESFASSADFICGHNIMQHDLQFLKDSPLAKKPFIDTLHLSPLLFPEKPYHRLVKDYKLQCDELNNPVADSKAARDLLYDELEAFSKLAGDLKKLYTSLLYKQPAFENFFKVANTSGSEESLLALIKKNFNPLICSNAPFNDLIENEPVILSYALAIISTSDTNSISPAWLIHQYPTLNQVVYQLRMKRCQDQGCNYCNGFLNPANALKEFFGFDDFRKFSEHEKIPLQEQVVKAALNNKSILAIFPTGGGKSLTFQLPALMTGDACRALTVVISPLQSLMKDQIDVLNKRHQIVKAVTINGLLSPLERREAMERIAEGGAHILYISPESLRSNSILTLLQKRLIARFVIDEAHCFSSWGQDFRVDYLYIAEFIKELQKLKNLPKNIPISCFTATAKPQVIEDIKSYFQEKLSISLETFSTDAKRTNLTYGIYDTATEEKKLATLINLLLQKDGPKIIYVSRTKTAVRLAEYLKAQNFSALAFHGKLDSDVKIKNQNEFMEGRVDIIVATSAFGMGVDKDNVGMVIHYDISDSLENYAQEAGRAGRKKDLSADCYILFDENDLNKHFALLNNTKLSIKEIRQVWSAIKLLAAKKNRLSKSALEIAKKAGWDVEMRELETRVTAAIAALEDAGYLKRRQNSPRVFASSIAVRNAEQAILRINESVKLDEISKQNAIRLIKRLIADKHSIDRQETRTDYLSEILGINIHETQRIINVLRDEGILGDAMDLSCFVNSAQSKNNAKAILKSYVQIENGLIDITDAKPQAIYLKELNERLIEDGVQESSVDRIKDIIRYWEIKNVVKKKKKEGGKVYYLSFNLDKTATVEWARSRHALANDIIAHFLQKAGKDQDKDSLIEFSLVSLKKAIEGAGLFSKGYNLEDYESALLFLNAIAAIKLEDGFLVSYKALNIDDVETNNRHFTKDDYEKLETYYSNKVQQIHIVGEYAKKLLINYNEALNFVDDYFVLNYNTFIAKYFPNRKEEISRSLSHKKFEELFSTLSTKQFEIIKEKTKNILIAAGPGSGKTKVLVHKVASLLLMEDVKPSQFLMLTFSRSASLEFRERLKFFIDETVYRIDIHTYHSYCFDLTGRVGDLDKSKEIIKETAKKIKEGEIIEDKIAKGVLVLDEFQDINEDEFELITQIIEKNKDEIRVLAVGDDDQTIYDFRGASAKYIQQFSKKFDSSVFELLTNYRSRKNLVSFSNQFVKTIQSRLKQSEIEPFDKESIGSIFMTNYINQNILIPTVNDIVRRNFKGTTAVLTSTNEEAGQITSLFRVRGIRARLIQADEENFSLYNLLELRAFCKHVFSHIENEAGFIPSGIWAKSKKKLSTDFAASPNLNLALLALQAFEKSYKRKVRFELVTFLREIRIEDLVVPERNNIIVSTMHKAKGKEFDNVFVVLKNYVMKDDAARRLLYVAITRAKKNLIIHTNNNPFSFISDSATGVYNDATEYSAPSELLINLTHRDVKLYYFKLEGVQYNIGLLAAGSNLKYLETEKRIVNTKGKAVLLFSDSFIKKIDDFLSEGYKVENVKVNYILYWHDKEDDPGIEYKIVLPSMLFNKSSFARDTPESKAQVSSDYN
ncbi:RecQ family ATP-dependent DNA helicase [Fulvivirgaceae bacterium PWU4]|uniref:DNA 3'-5' helicase n=1 Tax=Chryseosolibacter histidini TaxID=2782349 RepID=A0AAP2DKG1_9BACT|nr:RecQ family ATP-dependent DNA helicase [Chryseosolibacter histidini]MBT1697159.1 RecQ family ATP-dependent DNA helicase [Chryseosolibacter histidini]